MLAPRPRVAPTTSIVGMLDTINYWMSRLVLRDEEVLLKSVHVNEFH